MSSNVTVLGSQIAVDGKTMRGSANDGPPVHKVNAFATDLGLALGHVKVSGKSNQITAIRVSLEALYLKGFLVSNNTMGCQGGIAATITSKGGDYLLAMKGNQPSLLEAIEVVLIDRKANVITQGYAKGGHGRVVGQLARVLPALGSADSTACGVQDDWMISSRALRASELAVVARLHWAVENQLHWVLIVNFGEDANSVGKGSARQNLSLPKKIVLTLARHDGQRHGQPAPAGGIG